MSITPRSDYLLQEVAKVMNQYMEGALTSPETCIKLMLMIEEDQNRVWDENNALLKVLSGE